MSKRTLYQCNKLLLYPLYIQIECPTDYKQWLVSMFSLFGTKFVRLFSGPMWSIAPTSQCEDDEVELDSHHHPLDVCHDLFISSAYFLMKQSLIII